PARSARRATLDRAARLAEERLNLQSNPLINSLQLGRSPTPSAGLEHALAARALERGDEAARAIDQTRILSTRPARLAWLRAAVAIASLALVALLAPRLVATVLPRYADPFGDHPPYTRTEFNVTFEPGAPLVGDEVTVRVDLGGVLPSSLEAVIVSEGDIEEDPITLIPKWDDSGKRDRSAHAASYSTMFHDVRAPLTFFLRGDTGRSPRFTISPIPEPRIVDASLTITPPPYTRWAPTTVPLSALNSPHAEAIRAIVGSTAELRVATTMDLDNAEASPSEATTTISGQTAHIATTLNRAEGMVMSLRPRAASGMASSGTVTAMVDVHADLPPTIEVAQPSKPGGEIYVLAGADVPVAASAKDDVGLALFEARIARKRGDTTGKSSVLPLASRDRAFVAGVPAFSGTAVLRTGELDLRPGDAVEVTLTARDGRTPDLGGAHETRTPPIRVVILDAEEFQRRFAGQLDAGAITKPYTDLAKSLDELDTEATAIAGAAHDLENEKPRTELNEDQRRLETSALRSRRAALARQRDAIRDRIERRLELPAAVSFDDQMRPTLESIEKRLSDIASDGPTGAATSDTDRDADLAAAAAAEARTNLVRSAQELEMADRLQQSLERLKRVLPAQRRLADRLDGADGADEQSRHELNALQSRIQAELTASMQDLTSAGAKASQELPEGEPPADLANQLTLERALAQKSLERLRLAAASLPNEPSTREARDAANAAADAGMTFLYGSAEHLAQQLRAINPAPKSLADPGAFERLEPLPDAVRNLMDAIRNVMERLHAAEQATSTHTISRRSAFPHPATAIALLLMHLSADDPKPAPAASKPSPPADAASRAALEAAREARLKLERLSLTLEKTAQRFQPLLPSMGESAIDLSKKAGASGAAGLMDAAKSAIDSGDMITARRHALAAAEALEKMYAEAAQSGGESPPNSGLDRKLQLTKPSNAEKPEGDESDPNQKQSGPPDTLDQLSQNRQAGQSESESQSMNSDELSKQEGEAEAQNAPDRAGATPAEAQSESESQQQPSESQADPSQRAQQELAERRARWFNEKLYGDPSGNEKHAQTAVEGSAEGKSATPAEGAPAEPNADAVRRALERVTGHAIPDAAAAYAQVPGPYRSIVGQYFLKIAAEQDSKSSPASRGGRAP
ncbi:MAG TPA: hypothetical protein VG797_06555, partial [Phycisphaerales bacterium]|nr:hypothetical protein [Phycisphaerales bacterium]